MNERKKECFKKKKVEKSKLLSIKELKPRGHETIFSGDSNKIVLINIAWKC